MSITLSAHRGAAFRTAAQFALFLLAAPAAHAQLAQYTKLDVRAE